MDHVVWLGGGCGSGKSTLARRLAYRFNLRLYPVDAYAYAHEARATPTEPRPFGYACECTALGCTATLPLTPAAYRAAGGANAHR
jgi:hypothetical protein